MRTCEPFADGGIGESAGGEGKRGVRRIAIRGGYPPDREQPLRGTAIQDVIHNEVQRRHEAADVFYNGGQTQRAEMEKAEIAILKDDTGTRNIEKT